MKFKVISAFSLGGGKDMEPGDIIDMDEASARSRVHLGYIVAVPPEVVAAPEAAPEPEPEREPEGHATTEHKRTRGKA